MAKARRTNVFTNRKSRVSMYRNGLTIEVEDVPAVDAGVVAKELLDVIRQLQRAGYEELILDGGSIHSDPIAVEDEVDGDDFVLPPEAKRIGF